MTDAGQRRIFYTHEFRTRVLRSGQNMISTRHNRKRPRRFVIEAEKYEIIL